jgi:mannose-6-phosphate isomerase-like protein (cupin superfamily)
MLASLFSRAVGLSLAFTFAANGCVQADVPSATVTERVNIVEHGKGTSAEQLPAVIGTVIPDGEYVVTGAKSRAELTLPSASITRLGANTIFNYSADSNTIDLEAGTILFCKPKSARQLNIKTAAVTAAIVGTTGFVNVHKDAKGHKIFIFGIVEGHATVVVQGQELQVGDGDCLWFSPGVRVKPFSYDLPRYAKSSPLLTAFRSPLPNQAEIDAAVKNKGTALPPDAGQIIYGGDIPALTPVAAAAALNTHD